MLHSQPYIEAILLIGSTAFKKTFDDWDDFDIQVYTRGKPRHGLYYEIIKDGKRRHLLGIRYFALDETQSPAVSVLQQKDVQVLFGSEESLRHIFVWRPRKIEPVPKKLPRFSDFYEVHFTIMVDLFFILKRYEARGRPNTTKARLCRDGVRTFARHFYEFYGVEHAVGDRTRWRKVLADVARVLDERGFERLCLNREFVREAISLMEFEC